MISKKWMVGIVLLALFAGFAGGVWFIGSGVGFQLFPGSNAATSAMKGGPAGTGAGLKGGGSQGRSYSSSGGGFQQKADRLDLYPSDGCEWLVEPRLARPFADWLANDRMRFIDGDPLHPGMLATPARGVFIWYGVDGSTGGIRFTLLEFTTKGKPALELRPIGFDMDGRSYLPTPTGRSRTPNGRDEVAVTEFFLDTLEVLSRDDLTYVGIERIPSDEERQVVAAARKTAQDKGIPLLPPPLPGKPYPFELTTATGKTLRTQDFHGKAVLIGIFGSTWGEQTCQHQFQLIRQIYPVEQIEFISVSLNGPEARTDTMAKAKAKAQTKPAVNDRSGKSPVSFWSVVVPNDPEIQKLWREGTRLHRDPAYLLVDQDGVLRYVTEYQEFANPFGIQETIRTLFGDRLRVGYRVSKVGPPRLPPKRVKSVPASEPKSSERRAEVR